MVIMGSLYSLYIFIQFFFYHVNHVGYSWLQIKLLLLRLVVVAANIHYYSTETDITHMDDFLFFVFPPIFEKVVKFGSGSFEFYLLVRVISS